ncbi:LptA/OstA family protein [Brevundimonas sp.]|uniref:LptA/OstA family protein n=1 Tax=Brevundimonas sp. TaxID=1871086 RepID=UPI0027308DD8|nr:LptA/OstA family protein [Brevundimonas sp.]MDP1911913.1 LptA/OstA family protein [Brevundimonas sp.]
MTRTLGMAAVALTMLALPATGGAQTPPAGGGGGAVSFGADGGEYTSTGIALRGRAEVVQGQNRLRADSINGTIVSGDLTRVEASGNVYFVTPDQTIRGDRAVYTFANDEVVVTGDVILTQGQNVLTGGRLVYDTRTESARMEGGAGSSGGRIRGVFFPDNGGN